MAGKSGLDYEGEEEVTKDEAGVTQDMVTNIRLLTNNGQPQSKKWLSGPRAEPFHTRGGGSMDVRDTGNTYINTHIRTHTHIDLHTRYAFDTHSPGRKTLGLYRNKERIIKKTRDIMAMNK